jgi:hypothetical protein
MQSADRQRAPLTFVILAELHLSAKGPRAYNFIRILYLLGSVKRASSACAMASQSILKRVLARAPARCNLRQGLHLGLQYFRNSRGGEKENSIATGLSLRPTAAPRGKTQDV